MSTRNFTEATWICQLPEPHTLEYEELGSNRLNRILFQSQSIE